jgi:hypothetical protein
MEGLNLRDDYRACEKTAWVLVVIAWKFALSSCAKLGNVKWFGHQYDLIVLCILEP